MTILISDWLTGRQDSVDSDDGRSLVLEHDWRPERGGGGETGSGAGYQVNTDP